MKVFSIIAVAIFLLIGLVHLYRIAVGFPVAIGGADVGMAVSWGGLVVAAVMAVGLFREGMRGNAHHVTLVATFDPADPSRIIVSPKIHLPYNDGEYQFHFKLDDQTGKTVRFARLTSADDCSTCPPDPTKPNTQIHDVSPSGRTAKFKNRNNNRPPQPRPMDVSYQWEFTCDPGFTVEPFDPIISNGGRV